MTSEATHWSLFLSDSLVLLYQIKSKPQLTQTQKSFTQSLCYLMSEEQNKRQSIVLYLSNYKAFLSAWAFQKRTKFNPREKTGFEVRKRWG